MAWNVDLLVVLVADAKTIEAGFGGIRQLFVSDVEVGKKLVGAWWWRGFIQVNIELLTVSTRSRHIRPLADPERAGAAAKSRG